MAANPPNCVACPSLLLPMKHLWLLTMVLVRRLMLSREKTKLMVNTNTLLSQLGEQNNRHTDADRRYSMATAMPIQRRAVTVMTERVFQWWDYPIFAVLTVAIVAVS